jgi:hypothetical protein
MLLHAVLDCLTGKRKSLMAGNSLSILGDRQGLNSSMPRACCSSCSTEPDPKDTGSLAVPSRVHGSCSRSGCGLLAATPA